MGGGFWPLGRWEASPVPPGIGGLFLVITHGFYGCIYFSEDYCKQTTSQNGEHCSSERLPSYTVRVLPSMRASALGVVPVRMRVALR